MALAIGLATTPAHAADGATDSADAASADTASAEGGSGIVVTAQRRSQSALEVPMAVTAISAQRLTEERVERVGELIQATSNVEVREIRPGGYGRAQMAGTPVPVLAVPEAAVSYDGNGAWVTVIDAGDKVRRVAVRTGRRGDGLIELLPVPGAAAVAEGARVLTGSQDFVLDGDRVKPVAATQKGR